MAGFADVLLRGVLLVGAALALGGVVFAWLVLRAGPGVKPDDATCRVLRLAALGAVVVALAQMAVGALTLGALLADAGAAAAAPFARTPFALASTVRVILAAATAVLALALARGRAGRAAWTALAAAAVLLVASSASISHAIARLEYRPLLLIVDAAHQLAAAVWVGGLAHLVLDHRRRAHPTAPVAKLDAAALRRFSSLALVAVGALVVTGFGLSLAYVGDVGALLETAYGVMVLTKAVLLIAMLALGAANFRLVRRAAARAGDARLARYAEVEAGLAITVLFAAASLTSLPPAVDVREDRATVAEVTARFTPTVPRLVSPPVDELNRTAEPLMTPTGGRLAIERAWSEYNHHWAGFFVVIMGLGAIAERLGARWARHWPLIFLGLAAFLFVRNDPRAWPLGPAGFWESLTLPDVLQHRLFVVLVIAFGVFEWAVRTGRLRVQPWGYVFPLLCAVGGGLLLTHSHAMFNLKEEFLTEVTHAPLGIFGAFAGWGRWLELRMPEASARAGWLWTLCFTAVGVVLLVYREG